MSERTLDLHDWDTPFSGDLFPGVSVIPQPESICGVSIVVAPKGADKYPKYLVHFMDAIAFKCEDESIPVGESGIDAELSLGSARRGQQACAYKWPDSPWLKSYESSSQVIEALYPGPLRLMHYIILGADVVVEVVSVDEPTIEEINGPKLVATYEV